MISNEYKALRHDLRRKNITKKRRQILVIVVLVLISLFAVINLFSSEAFGAETHVEPKEVIVKNGDSLWNIASENSKGKDIRLVVNEIKKFNNLEDGNIYPGMIIMIPIEGY